jgi:hypothetical protein
MLGVLHTSDRKEYNSSPVAKKPRAYNATMQSGQENAPSEVISKFSSRTGLDRLAAFLESAEV